jgi:hypothetical protein
VSQRKPSAFVINYFQRFVEGVILEVEDWAEADRPFAAAQHE